MPRGMCEVVVLNDTQAFAALEAEWEDLYRNAPLATPFQWWAWLYSWWEFYGQGYELRLVTIRDEGLLVGLIPLILDRRRGFGRLLFVGTGPTDYQDVLARRGWESQVSEAGIRALRQMDGWQVADLQQLRSEAAAWSIFRRWRGPCLRVWQDNCPVIDVRPWEPLVASLSKNHRSTVRRALRRAQADGVEREFVSAEDAEKAGRRLIALHREAWQGRDIIPEHQTQWFEEYMGIVALRMTARGLGRITEFRRDGKAIISHFLFFGRSSVGEGLTGATQDALRRYQESSLRIWDAVNVAYQRNGQYVELLRGEESYKLRWSSSISTNYQVILGRHLGIWVPYSAYHLLLSRIKRYAYSEDAPQWTTKAWSKYRTLRDKLAR
jgi:CelD/BcsL family acetyltransferase involved in cellulose biosynthesis